MSNWILCDSGVWLDADKVLYFSVESIENREAFSFAIVATFPFEEDGEDGRERAWFFVREFSTEEEASNGLRALILNL